MRSGLRVRRGLRASAPAGPMPRSCQLDNKQVCRARFGIAVPSAVFRKSFFLLERHANMEQVNPWSQVVSLLSRLSSGSDITGGESWCAACRRGARTGRIGTRGKALEAMPVAAPHNRITAIERQSDTHVLISWRDPTMSLRRPGLEAVHGPLQRALRVSRPAHR